MLSLVLASKLNGQLACVAEVLGKLHGGEFDLVRQRLLVVRETYRCPPLVSSPAAFRVWPHDFYLHFLRSVHGVPASVSTTADESFLWFRQHYRGDLRTAERNALLGRDGGLIRICDELVESLIKTHEQAYLDRTLWEYVPTDPSERLGVAEELLGEFGGRLCPGDELRPAYELAADLENVMKGIALLSRGLRREWRY